MVNIDCAINVVIVLNKNKMYNFVMFQTPDDYFRLSQYDLTNIENVKYIDQIPQNVNSFFRSIYRAHFSDKINRKIERPLNIELPFRSIWNPYYYKNEFLNDKPIVFIFCGRYAFWSKYGLIEYLKNKYPYSKYVCYFQDIVKEHKRISIEDVKRNFDLVMSYDYGDAEKYNLEYHPTIYSNIYVKDNKDIQPCDVYFVGAAKNRLEELYNAYDILTEQGIKCDFYLINVPVKLQRKCMGIQYIKHMDYYTNLQHVLKCKGILEILQNGAVGASLRMKEALVFNKYFITNNNPSEKMFEEIDYNRYINIKTQYDISEKICSTINYNKELIEKISAQHFLNFIENKL